MNKGNLYVVSAPSGCGKDTIIQKVIERMNGNAMLSVSMTTRAMREGEAEGVNYYYVSHEQFHENIKNGAMLEYAVYGNNYYGTPIAPVNKALDEGKAVILIIEVKGGENVKKIFPDAKKIFIVPPSLEVLEKRLRGRGTDSEDAIAARLEIAMVELRRANEYDYIIENDDLEKAVDDVMAIIRANQLEYKNMQNKVREVTINA